MSIIELTTRKGQGNYSSDFKREKGTQGLNNGCMVLQRSNEPKCKDFN